MDEFDAQISWDNCLKDFHEDATKHAVNSPNIYSERSCHVHFHVFFVEEFVIHVFVTG